METFPYLRNKYQFEEIKKIFDTMTKSHRIGYTSNNITNQELPYFYGLIILENKSKIRVGKLSDFFQEQHRMDAKRYDEEYSPYQYWENNKEKNLSRKDIKVKECTGFPATIMCAIIKLFKPKHILDFSSGWGDRLIGTMTFDTSIKTYTGIDPNKVLHKGYKKMLKYLLPKSSHNKYQMINGCAEETIKTLNQNFDLVFTSPPYFDIESYSNHKDQSIQKFQTFEKWYQHFLLESVKQSVDKLESNGILAININNTKDYNIIDKLIEDVKNLEIMEFLGIIYFGNPKCKTTIYQPILIWKLIH